MGINEALDNLYVCATNAKSETLEEGYYEKCYDRVIEELNQKDKAEADLYEANNRINDLLDIVKQKDKIIDELVTWIEEHENPFEDCYEYKISCADIECKDCIRKYFEERCK